MIIFKSLLGEEELLDKERVFVAKETHDYIIFQQRKLSLSSFNGKFIYTYHLCKKEEYTKEITIYTELVASKEVNRLILILDKKDIKVTINRIHKMFYTDTHKEEILTSDTIISNFVEIQPLLNSISEYDSEEIILKKNIIDSNNYVYDLVFINHSTEELPF